MKLFANHKDDIASIQKIDRKTLVMTGSDDLDHLHLCLKN